jgi:cytochrome c biogenesis protein ResB
MELLRRVLHGLGLMRTAVFLLGLSALASMAGTLLVQGLPVQDYVTQFGPMWAKVLWYAGLTDVFRAWWFLGIQAILLASVSVCVCRNGPRIWKQVVKPKKNGQSRVNRLGYFCVHVGVLGVAVAGLVSGLAGWRGTMNLREGETDNIALVWRGKEATPEFLPFKVSNKGFEIEQYPSGMPKRYATTLGFDCESGKEGFTATPSVDRQENLPAPVAAKRNLACGTEVVEVNKPVHHGAYAFYQASFGDGGSSIAGSGVNLTDGAVVPFKARVYEAATLSDGTRVEILDFRPFTVETAKGERPTDVGPSVDYLVQPPDAPARQLRAYVNHPEIIGVADGQKVGGANDGVVLYAPVMLGVVDAKLWPLVARVAKGEDFKAVVGPVLSAVADEKQRVLDGLAVMQAAKVVKELGLTHVLLAKDFELRRYSGLQVAYDPAADFFWVFACVLLLGVVMMVVGRREE